MDSVGCFGNNFISMVSNTVLESVRLFLEDTMKRWLLWSFVSIATFVIGTLCGFAYLQLSTPLDSNDNKMSGPPSLNLMSEEPAEVTEFNVPESLFDLDFSKYDNKLIDIRGSEIYRQSEVVAKNGEQWFVLVKRKAQYSLKLSEARVRRLSSVSWPGEENDASLRFNTPYRPIIALRSVRGLKPGAVHTVFINDILFDPDAEIRPEQISTGYRRELAIGENKYVLRSATGLGTQDEKYLVFVLESAEKDQVLKAARQFPGERPIIGDLLWAGDLDQDGKLDLYFDRFNEVGAFVGRLYLSSHAKKGELVGLAAIFQTAGC